MVPHDHERPAIVLDQESRPPTIQLHFDSVIPQRAKVAVLESHHVILDHKVVTGIARDRVGPTPGLFIPSFVPVTEPRVEGVDRSGVMLAELGVDEIQVHQGPIAPGRIGDGFVVGIAGTDDQSREYCSPIAVFHV